MIVLDTTVLAYAVGENHPLREPSRELMEALSDGRLSGTTTIEVIQEFVHVRARRRARKDAAKLGRAFVQLLSPLLIVEPQELQAGLRLFERHEELGSFDAVLAATALAHDVTALVSADIAFGVVPRLPFVDLASPRLVGLLGSSG